MKKILSLLAVCMIFVGLASCGDDDDLKPTPNPGTSKDSTRTYLTPEERAAQLRDMQGVYKGWAYFKYNDYAGKYIELTGEAYDLRGEANWAPIGTGSRADDNGPFFCGTFNGNKKPIQNLTSSVNEDNKGAGLFGAVKNAEIYNVTVESGQVENTVDAAAGVVAIMLGDTCTVRDCENSAQVSGAAAGGVRCV